MRIFFDGIAIAVIALCELCNECHACGDAKQIRIYVVPPFVCHATACRDSRIDCESRATN